MGDGSAGEIIIKQGVGKEDSVFRRWSNCDFRNVAEIWEVSFLLPSLAVQKGKLEQKFLHFFSLICSKKHTFHDA